MLPLDQRQADAADTAAPSSEAMPTATAAAPADGAEDGSAGETSAVPNAESGALAAPVVEAGAPEALREPTSATGAGSVGDVTECGQGFIWELAESDVFHAIWQRLVPKAVDSTCCS